MTKNPLDIMRKHNPGYFDKKAAEEFHETFDVSKQRKDGSFVVREKGPGLDYVEDRLATSRDVKSGSETYPNAEQHAASQHTSCDQKSGPETYSTDPQHTSRNEKSGPETYSTDPQHTSRAPQSTTYQVFNTSNRESKTYSAHQDMQVSTCMSVCSAVTSEEEEIPDVDDVDLDTLTSKALGADQPQGGTLDDMIRQTYSSVADMPERLREQILEEWRLYVWVGESRPGFPETRASLMLYQGGRPVQVFTVDLRLDVTRWMVDTNKQQDHMGAGNKNWRRKLADWGRSPAKHGTRAVGSLGKNTQKNGRKVDPYQAVGLDFTRVSDTEWGQQAGVVQLWWRNFMYTVRCEVPGKQRASKRGDRVLWLQATWTRNINAPKAIDNIPLKPSRAASTPPGQI